MAGSVSQDTPFSSMQSPLHDFLTARFALEPDPHLGGIEQRELSLRPVAVSYRFRGI